MTNEQRIIAIRARLAQIEGNRDYQNERYVLREELRVLKAKLRDEEDETPVGPDSVWETLRGIAALEDTLKIFCEDKTVNPQALMAAGFRGAVRLAKQALKDAGKT